MCDSFSNSDVVLVHVGGSNALLWATVSLLYTLLQLPARVCISSRVAYLHQWKLLQTALHLCKASDQS